MINKIVITGGNGFLGRSLARYFQQKGTHVVVVSRSAAGLSEETHWQKWDGKNFGLWAAALEGADAVINLAGKNVDCRYTEKNKAEILNSRLDSTKAVGDAIARYRKRPKVWINASSATIYEGSLVKLMTEANGDIGNDFSMTVCKAWESAFNSFTHLNVRQVSMRISIVLGMEGAALPALTNLAKFGLGGAQGNGEQFCSWIHINDFCRAVEWLINNDSAKGAYNLTAPTSLPNKEFMKTLGAMLEKPFGMPTPQWLLELGAFFLRTETELVLKSRNVYPKRLLEEGFDFEFKTLAPALNNLLKEKHCESHSLAMAIPMAIGTKSHSQTSSTASGSYR